MVIDVRANAPAQGETDQTVEVYDFGRPATLAREHARALELSFETFARLWATQLTDKIRARSHVAVEQVELQTYAEYADGLPSTTTVVVCAVPESEASGIVQFPLSAALSWIVQMVGGRPVEVTDERPLTTIEQALIRYLMADGLETLSHALGALLPGRLAVSGIQYNPQFAQLASAGDLVIVARLSLSTGDRTVPASVMLPAALVLERLSSAAPVMPADRASELVHEQVEHTPLELALRLTPLTVHPTDVLDLSVGDLIRIPHADDRPLDLVAGGVPVASAAVGASGARLACVITSVPSDPAAPSDPVPAEEPR